MSDDLLCLVGEQIALLVSQTRERAKTHNVKNTELAEMLLITPQVITEIFKGRNQPTGEQVLEMLELMRSQPSCDRDKKL
jgi:hypothetical protein